MRGRVAVLSLFLLVLSLPASSQCNWTNRFSGQYRTTALDLAVDGEQVWLATGYGVQLFDGTTLLDSASVTGTTRAIATSGNGIAYAGSGATIYVLTRTNGRIHVTSSVATSGGGTVNDLVLAGGYLFAATSQGIEHFSLANASGPVRTAANLSTSSKNVLSLAATRDTLYAADGDASVETFSITVPSLPQGTGALEAMPLAASVHVTPDGYVFVSDRFGQNTDVFTGTTRVARIPVGTNAFAPSSSLAHFAAGPDRTLRALDFSSFEAPAELYELQLSPTDGTDNVIHAMERAGDTIYIAAGDIGLVTLDAGSIARPYPVVSYNGGATTSVAASGNKVWFGSASGTISEQSVDAGGIRLTEVRNWAAGGPVAVHDVRDNGLLTTSDASATVWALPPATPAAAINVTFPQPITAAVLGETSMIALLANNTVYAVANNAPQKLNLPPMSLLARSDSTIAMAEVRETERVTVLHYWMNGDVTSASKTAVIEGAATGAIALDPNRAAVFTFTGLNVIDLASGNVRTIAGSNTVIPQQLAFAGGDLLAGDGRRIFVYADARTLVRTLLVPADVVALDTTGTLALLATIDGTAAVSSRAEQPVARTPYASAFYAKAAAGRDRLYLLDRDSIAIFSTATGEVPRFTGSIDSAGVVDAAANDDGAFTVGANGTVSAYSRAGALVAQKVLSEGTDMQPLSIATAGSALWVSLSTGCTTGGCVKKTLVLDPATLATTDTLSGAVRDVTVSGSRAYALFDAPNEMRVLNLADPLHPATLVSAARPATATSIAAANDAVHVLGDKLYSFNESTLAPAGERLDAIAPDESQRIRIEGNCAVITGRGESALVYALPSFAPASPLALPSNARGIALAGGRIAILTAHSLEIWSAAPQAPPSKRRAF